MIRLKRAKTELGPAPAWVEDARALLQDVKVAGTFCCETLAGSCEKLAPEVRIGEEPLPLPLADAQLDSLKARGILEVAPFGKGTDTVVDENVRRALQVDASRVSIGGEGWRAALDSCVASLARGLGIDGDSGVEVEARLYKMVFYEAGGFFVKHRDTEKEPGMFGTLAVQLPTVTGFEGGNLIVRHAGKKKTIDWSGDRSTGAIHAAAFFADCEHELTRVETRIGATRAVRVALLYNLVWKGTRVTRGTRVPSAPDTSESLKKLASVVKRWGLALRPTFEPYGGGRSEEQRLRATKAEVMLYKLEHKV